MKKIAIIISTTALLIVSSFTISPALGLFVNLEDSGSTWYVGGYGPGNYSKIQNAIDNASIGDTIFVFNGTYYENVLINKSIQLIGENEENTIINGMYGLYCISVESQDVTIKYFKITNSSKDGIRVIEKSDDAKVFNCILENSRWSGIFIENTEYLKIKNCRFVENLNGIVQTDSNYSIINNCDFENDQWNIYLQRSDNNKILNCTISETSNSSFGNDGIYLIWSSGNEIYNCTVSNMDDAISFYRDSSYNTIDECNIINNEDRGIVISRSISNNILNSIISNADSGIEFYDDTHENTKYNTIDNCVISGHKDTGVLFTHTSNNNKIINSEVSNNNIGVFCWSPTYNNYIYNNEFIDNTEYQAYDSGNNIWNNNYPDGGNHWSDYTGFDKFKGPNQDIPGCDGIGDTPYQIQGGSNKDRYPLVTLDNEPPEIEITKPIKALYIINIRLRRYLFRKPLIIGKITIEANATDKISGIERVEFYIDGKLKETLTTPPYTYTWKRNRIRILGHRHKINIMAYDNSGNSASDEITVWRFL